MFTVFAVLVAWIAIAVAAALVVAAVVRRADAPTAPADAASVLVYK